MKLDKKPHKITIRHYKLQQKQNKNIRENKRQVNNDCKSKNIYQL